MKWIELDKKLFQNRRTLQHVSILLNSTKFQVILARIRKSFDIELKPTDTELDTNPIFELSPRKRRLADTYIAYILEEFRLPKDFQLFIFVYLLTNYVQPYYLKSLSHFEIKRSENGKFQIRDNQKLSKRELLITKRIAKSISKRRLRPENLYITTGSPYGDTIGTAYLPTKSNRNLKLGDNVKRDVRICNLRFKGKKLSQIADIICEEFKEERLDEDKIAKIVKTMDKKYSIFKQNITIIPSV